MITLGALFVWGLIDILAILIMMDRFSILMVIMQRPIFSILDRLSCCCCVSYYWWNFLPYEKILESMFGFRLVCSILRGFQYCLLFGFVSVFMAVAME